MRTSSVDLREGILAAYDSDQGTRADVAHRFGVALGLVKKLLQQHRRTGAIAPRHRFSGRKPTIVASHRPQLRVLLTKKNDRTLRELRAATGLKCSLQAINVVLAKLGLTYKKRHFTPARKTVPTSHGHAGVGANNRRAGTRPS